jgi:hypothetical protein
MTKAEWKERHSINKIDMTGIQGTRWDGIQGYTGIGYQGLTGIGLQGLTGLQGTIPTRTNKPVLPLSLVDEAIKNFNKE